MVSKRALGDYACVEIYRMVIDECKKGYNTSFFGSIVVVRKEGFEDLWELFKIGDFLEIYGIFLRFTGFFMVFIGQVYEIFASDLPLDCGE